MSDPIAITSIGSRELIAAIGGMAGFIYWLVRRSDANGEMITRAFLDSVKESNEGVIRTAEAISKLADSQKASVNQQEENLKQQREANEQVIRVLQSMQVKLQKEISRIDRVRAREEFRSGQVDSTPEVE